MNFKELTRNEINAVLTDMSLKELQSLAKHLNYQITGAWKMKKADLAKAIFIEWEKEVKVEVKEEIIEEQIALEEIKEEVKPKPSRRVKRPVTLRNENGEVVQNFESAAEAIKYCSSNSIANEGWAKVSLAQNRKMYRTVEGKLTTPQKGKYTGIDYILEYTQES